MVVDCLAAPRRVSLEELGKPAATILDCTAGNRHIWGKEKFRGDVVFFDKEPRLRVAPDVLGRWRDLSTIFAPDTFRCAIFDPPHFLRFDADMPRCQWIHGDPEEQRMKNASWWGYFKTRRQLISELVRAQAEISKVSPRMCLKWCDAETPIENVLGLFSGPNGAWDVVVSSEMPSKGIIKGKSRTWWVRLARRAP